MCIAKTKAIGIFVLFIAFFLDSFAFLNHRILHKQFLSVEPRIAISFCLFYMKNSHFIRLNLCMFKPGYTCILNAVFVCVCLWVCTCKCMWPVQRVIFFSSCAHFFFLSFCTYIYSRWFYCNYTSSTTLLLLFSCIFFTLSFSSFALFLVGQWFFFFVLLFCFCFFPSFSFSSSLSSFICLCVADFLFSLFCSIRPVCV